MEIHTYRLAVIAAAKRQYKGKLCTDEIKDWYDEGKSVEQAVAAMIDLSRWWNGEVTA